MGKNKQRTYGKSVRQYFGYNIRTMLKDGKNPSGKFGIFAGKKMLQEVPNVDTAIVEIDKLISK